MTYNLNLSSLLLLLLLFIYYILQHVPLLGVMLHALYINILQFYIQTMVNMSHFSVTVVRN